MVEKSENSGEDQANFAWSTLEEMDAFLRDKQLLRRLRTFIVDY